MQWLPRADWPAAGAAAPAARADALIERLCVASEDVRALEAEASRMVADAECALRVALGLLAEEIAAQGRREAAGQRGRLSPPSAGSPLPAR